MLKTTALDKCSGFFCLIIYPPQHFRFLALNSVRYRLIRIRKKYKVTSTFELETKGSRVQQFRIRKGIIDDSVEISSLISRNSKVLLADDFEDDGLDFFLRSVEAQSIREYMEQGFRYLVAEYNDVIVGVIAIKDFSHMFHLFVDKDYHQRGIAKMLWQDMRSYSFEKGNRGFFTLNSTTYALPIYQRWGFEITSEAKRAYGIRYTPMKLIID